MASSPLPSTVQSALAQVQFRDPAAAERGLRSVWATLTGVPGHTSALASSSAETLFERLLLTLQDVANPDGCLVSFERFWHRADDPRELAAFLVEQPRAIEILTKIFVGSQYLTETLLKHPAYLRQLTQHRELADLKSREDFIHQAKEAIAQAPNKAAALAGLRRYQQWEILRIGACDAFGLIDLRNATTQLSLLADGLVNVCLSLSASELGLPADCLTVIAMGKLGGEELNYSSDIDLILLSERPPAEVTPVGQRLIKALQEATSEGFLYRVDMRLRPWGRAGELVSTVPAYLEYLATHAADWERQALLKARVIAGSRSLGETWRRQISPMLFRSSAANVRRSVRTAKLRIEQELRKQGKHWGDVKSGHGSIRDVEFVAQYLQLVHGGKQPHVRSANTLDALIRLTDSGLLTAEEYRQLTSGYVFLRTVEHALQLAHNKQRHSLPADPHELLQLARRLDFPDAQSFIAHYEQHRQAIRRIYSRHLEDEPPASSGEIEIYQPPGSSTAASTVEEVGYQTLFSSAERAEHAERLARVEPDQPVNVSAVPLEGGLWRVTILGIDCPGDLSIICGLLFVYGFNILDGLVTTGQHKLPSRLSERFRQRGHRPGESPRDFVNVFTVRGPYDGLLPEVWLSYEADLLELLLQLRKAGAGDAQGRLVKRVAAALNSDAEDLRTLLPVQIELDNSLSERGTVLQIRAEDTIGFLYELTNALALSSINIEQVVIRSEGERIFDTLVVTDAQRGGKIQDPERLQKLRAAVVLIKQFTHLLPRSSNPEAALLHFRTFVRDLFERPDWLEELSSLDKPDVLDALAQLLGVSDFLWEDFLRLQHSNLFPILRDISTLEVGRARAELATTLASQLQEAKTLADRKQVLNAFKDREMFRADMRHILGRTSQFEAFAEELTTVTEVVLDAGLRLAEHEMTARFGSPRLADGSPCRWSVCALGKCGGRELGFASDIELLFVYAGDGMTDGATSISAAEYFQRLVEHFTHLLEGKREGIFHIDMRLRPYGNAGALAIPLEAFWNYFRPEGPAWSFERQFLVKLRPIAGDAELGEEIVRLRDKCIYIGREFDFAAMRALRERQLRQLVEAGSVNAKLSLGGLVDVEYLVQGLQISNGHRSPRLRPANTLAAIEALAAEELLDTAEAEDLAEAYRFWRRLIDALRMVRGNARDLTVPASNSEEFEFLVRRLGDRSSSHHLLGEMDRHARRVTALMRRYERSEPPVP